MMDINNITCVTGTANPSGSPEFNPGFCGVVLLDLQSSVQCCVDRCLPLLFYPLCCLSFLNLRLLITPLVSSNFSHRICRYEDEMILFLFGYLTRSRNCIPPAGNNLLFKRECLSKDSVLIYMTIYSQKSSEEGLLVLLTCMQAASGEERGGAF